MKERHPTSTDPWLARAGGIPRARANHVRAGSGTPARGSLYPSEPGVEPRAGWTSCLEHVFSAGAPQLDSRPGCLESGCACGCGRAGSPLNACDSGPGFTPQGVSPTLPSSRTAKHAHNARTQAGRASVASTPAAKRRDRPKKLHHRLTSHTTLSMGLPPSRHRSEATKKTHCAGARRHPHPTPSTPPSRRRRDCAWRASQSR